MKIRTVFQRVRNTITSVRTSQKASESVGLESTCVCSLGEEKASVIFLTLVFLKQTINLHSHAQEWSERLQLFSSEYEDLLQCLLCQYTTAANKKCLGFLSFSCFYCCVL